MMAWLWLAVSIAGLWVSLVLLFMAVFHAKAVIDRGEELHWTFLYPAYLGAAAALILDFAFNVALGAIVMKDPRILRDFLFTSRLKYWKKQDGWRKRRAEWFCNQLNKFDPGHC